VKRYLLLNIFEKKTLDRRIGNWLNYQLMLFEQKKQIGFYKIKEGGKLP